MATIRVKLEADARDLQARLAEINGQGAAVRYSSSRGLPGTYESWRAGKTAPEWQAAANALKRNGVNGAGVMSGVAPGQFGALASLLGAGGMGGAASQLRDVAFANKVREGGGMYGRMYGGIGRGLQGRFGMDAGIANEMAMALTKSVRDTLQSSFKQAARNIGRGAAIGGSLLVGAAIMGAEGQAAKYSLGRMAQYGTVSSPADVQAGIRQAGEIAGKLGIGYGAVSGAGPKDQVVDFLNAIALKTPATAYSAAAAARTLAIATGMDFKTSLASVPSILSAAAVTASSPEDAAMGLMTYSQTGQRRSLQAAVGLTPEQLGKYGFKRGSSSTETMQSLLGALNRIAVDDPRYKNALRSLQEEPQTAFSNLGDAFFRAVEPIARILSASVVPPLDKIVGLLQRVATYIEKHKAAQWGAGALITAWGVNKLTDGGLGRLAGYGWRAYGAGAATAARGAAGRGLAAAGLGSGFLTIATIVAMVLAAGGKMIASWWESKSEKLMRRNESAITIEELDAQRKALGLPSSGYVPKTIAPRGTVAELKGTDSAATVAAASAGAAFGGVMA